MGLTDTSVDVMRIIDKLDKIGFEKVCTELEKINISKLIIEKIVEFLEIQGETNEKIEKIEKLNINNEKFKTGLEELKEVIKYIRLFKVPEENFMIDLTIARGLDYYTGTVYETTLNDYKQIGSVCSGGRYDNLAEYYTDKKFPGVGISIGLTRLFDKLIELDLIKNKKTSISDILVVPASEEDMEYSINITSKLRENNIKTEVYLEDKKLKAKFKYADRQSIPYIVVIGEDERKENVLTLKTMETGEQEKLKIEDIINKVKG